MVELDDEGDLVGVLAGYGGQHAKGGGHGIATALYGELHDVLGVEVDGVGREGGGCRMLYPLVYREYGEVARAAKPPVVKERLEAAEYLRGAVRVRYHPIYKICPG